MSRVKALSSLLRRGQPLLTTRVASAATPQVAAVREYAVITAATAAAATAAGGTTLRVFGWQVPYSWIIGSSLGLGLGIYFYETLTSAKERDLPLQQALHARPSISSLDMVDQVGRRVTASTLAGKHALLTFGKLKVPSDLEGLNVAARAAEAAKERTGAEVVPIFIDLDPEHDKPERLRKVAQAAGNPSLLMLTGDPDAVLAAVDKFKKQELAARMAQMKDQEHYKHGDILDDVDLAEFIYLVDPNGQIVRMWPRNSPVTGIATEVCKFVKGTEASTSPKS